MKRNKLKIKKEEDIESKDNNMYMNPNYNKILFKSDNVIMFKDQKTWSTLMLTSEWISK